MLDFIKLFFGFDDYQRQLQIKVGITQDNYWYYDYQAKSIEIKKQSINEKNLISAHQKSGKIYLSKGIQDSFKLNTTDLQLMGMIEPTMLQSGERTFMFHPGQKARPPTLFELLTGGYQYQNAQFLSSDKIINSYILLQKQKGNPNYYQLKQNDIIKFGFKKFKVTLIQHNDFSQRSTATNFLTARNQEFTLKSDELKQGVCKICLAGAQENNQLISPCECRGSCSNIHITCLQKWIANRGSVIKNKNVQSLYYNKFHCEICKKRLPEKIFIKDRFEYLFQIQKPSNSFMILQSIESKQQFGKTIFVISPKQNQNIVLGRKQNCDIRIQDQSTSKYHAFIKLQNGKFLIKDNNSKFGTLIKITKPIDLKKNNFIQAERFHIEFQIK